MTITYRKLTKNDLDIFIKMRIHQLREEGAKDEIDLEPTLRDYYLRHLSDGTFISWLALDNDRIIGTSGMSIVVDEAEKQGCGTVQITASDMGVLLYSDFGFEKNNNFMQYKL